MHTPAPWYIYDAGYGKSDIINATDPDFPDEKIDICEMSMDLPYSDRKVNAQLIAAAPDLLEACQLLYDQLQEATDYVSGLEPFPTDHNAGMWNAALKQSKSAIQKATGGT